MSAVRERVAAILTRRREQLPSVMREIERWQGVDRELEVLEGAVAELRALDQAPVELRAGLVSFDTSSIRAGIAKAIEHLRVLEARLKRTTLNIGVSGRARVGKSTLLQSISGLGDDQIPTGSGLPVTAVRSRIYHSTVHERATLVRHDFQSFRKHVLRPFCEVLGLGEPPINVNELRVWQLPATAEELSDSTARAQHKSVTLLRRLHEMQESLDSYQADLVSGERTVPLEGLRDFVAYPQHAGGALDGTANTPANSPVARPYLAIREARIECRFPHDDVDHIGIIDLPGLGELTPAAEKQHLDGLKNEVDFVLLVKRPLEGMAFWGQEDGAAASLLDEARGFIEARRDFVAIVLNSGGAGVTPTLLEALRSDIQAKANEGADGRHFTVFEADCADVSAVSVNVIGRALAHLAERLPVMDAQIRDGVSAECKRLAGQVEAALHDVEGALSALPRNTHSEEELLERSKRLREDLAEALQRLLGELDQERLNDDVTPFEEALETTYNEVHQWVEAGLGLGEAEWLKEASRSIRVQKGAAGFAEQELNRVRVELANRFCKLDAHFQDRVEGLWGRIVSDISPALGQLLADERGQRAMERLATALEESPEPCPTLAGAVRELLALRIGYRSHFHPQVRRALDSVAAVRRVPDPNTGELRLEPQVIQVDADRADELLREIRNLAHKGAYDTKSALLDQARLPAQVLHASAEHFEDTLIRAADSDREFRRFGRAYREELWPGVFSGLDASNARSMKVSRALKIIREQLREIEQGTV